MQDSRKALRRIKDGQLIRSISNCITYLHRQTRIADGHENSITHTRYELVRLEQLDEF